MTSSALPASAPPKRYTEDSPLITVATLLRDLQALGVEPGMTVMVHSSIKAVAGGGYIVGGLPSVIHALMEAVTPDGTLVMPTHTTHNTDPAGWSHPPVPASWVETIRVEMPAFDPLRTPSQTGRLTELFRTYPGVLRSRHPIGSCAAWGRHAAQIISGDPCLTDLGPEGPIGQVYALDGWVLTLGTRHHNNTSLHLAEHFATWEGKTPDITPSAMMLDGKRVLYTIRTESINSDDFDELGAAFEVAHPEGWRAGPVGAAYTRLLQQRPMVDFAVGWMSANRPASLARANPAG
jgi:aminoglycoside 3-N-acetyltransferase